MSDSHLLDKVSTHVCGLGEARLKEADFPVISKIPIHEDGKIVPNQHHFILLYDSSILQNFITRQKGIKAFRIIDFGHVEWCIRTSPSR